ncbi:hypothetical protein COLO4_28592 [Corchorus olitorius]|uniref:Uncharacterized protein n=1 Tax=Corchorus olitorius TaxID=93759 RepID=A0A1R3HJF7_9ROSI|nr:hypothetical protein COLO4_28592 [Corchorus olitorius]
MTSFIVGNKTSCAIRPIDAHDSVRSSIPRSNDIHPRYILGLHSFSSGKFRMKVKRSSRLLRLITDSRKVGGNLNWREFPAIGGNDL